MTIKDYKHSRSDLDKMIATRSGERKTPKSNTFNKMLANYTPRKRKFNFGGIRKNKPVSLAKVKCLENE